MLREMIRVLELSNGKSLDVSIRRDGEGLLMVELRTNLGAVAPDLDPAAAQLRAALAHPLLLRGTIAEFEGDELRTALMSYANTLAPVASAFSEALVAFKEQAGAAAEKAKSRPKAGKSKTVAAGPSPVDDDATESVDDDAATVQDDGESESATKIPAPAAFDNSNPASLF